MIDIKYGYLIGSIAGLIFWLFLFWIRKDLRKKMFFSSIMVTPTVFIDRFVVPTYWHPPSVFNLINKIGFGVEDLITAFVLGGIISVLYGILFRRRLIKNNQKTPNIINFLPYIILLSSYFIIFIISPFIGDTIHKHMWSCIVPALVAGLLIIILRKDLLVNALASGIIFLIMYFISQQIFLLVFPGYILETYNLQNLYGIFIFNIPIEEFIWAFITGMMMGPLYEFTYGFKTRKIKIVRAA